MSNGTRLSCLMKNRSKQISVDCPFKHLQKGDLEGDLIAIQTFPSIAPVIFTNLFHSSVSLFLRRSFKKPGCLA
jgi:hypothetical protein